VPDSRLLVEVDGTTVGDDDLLALVEVTVEESVDAGDAVHIAASVDPDAGGQWTSLLDPLTTPRTPLVVGITNGDVSYRFEGSSTEAEWVIDAGGSSSLAVKAIDRTLDMDAVEQVVAWPGASDATIASAIFAGHGLGAQVDDTPDGPDPDVHVVLQRATDWAFLRALAAKWGYAVFVEADGEALTGHFRLLDPLADPQATLSLGFGGDATKVRVTARLTAGETLTASRVRTLSDATDTGTADGTDKAQGSTPLGGQVTLLLTPDDVDGEIDATATVTGLARRAASSVTLEVDLDVATTGIMLRSRRTVLVKGLGDTLSGRYLVERVRHRLTPGGHTQSVTLTRNALGLTGDEPFGDGLGLPGGL
jgi:hypothetical protein